MPPRPRNRQTPTTDVSDTLILTKSGVYRKGMDVESLKLSIANQLKYSLAKDHYSATPNDWYLATALTVRDRLVERWIDTQRAYYRHNSKRVYYLSLEYLMGRTLANALINLGLHDSCRDALASFGVSLEEIEELEPDPGLGNGGLGRLAACFLDSMATLQFPASGYGLRYEFGLFNQVIRGGGQMEEADAWLRHGNPWEIPRPEYTMVVRFGGRSVPTRDARGRTRFTWIDTQDVLAIPYDTPIPGYGVPTVNNLRLWAAQPVDVFEYDYFNHGDYMRAIEQKALTENITRALYPNDSISQGKELRLKQQYFLVSATLQDVVRRYLKTHETYDDLPDKVAIQLNDTHPSLAIPELMRLLVDEGEVPWDRAWDIGRRVFGYTNHTLLPEALETWSVDTLGRLLPRHLEIVYEINRRFLEEVEAKWPGDGDRVRRLSLIEEGSPRSVRMANLAIVGSHAVNGVAELHTRLLRSTVVPDFAEMFPDRFQSKTNGVTQRRWLRTCNPMLAQLITEAIGDAWIRDLFQLKRLERLADDAEFGARWRGVKQENKRRLGSFVERSLGARLSPESMFDVQVKRIHEYKRQHLNVLRVIDLYHRIREMPKSDWVPRTVIFGGKSAPGYFMAKLIIRLVHTLADAINSDPLVRDRLRVVFLPNYRVSLAEKIIPAADLSEQISTAGKEASGTGNMKFAMNGALTVGTLDGANVEIREDVGGENFFLFGMTAEEVAARRASYRPQEAYEADPRLKRILDELAAGRFSPGHPDLFRPLVSSLLERDEYFVLADFAAYVECQDRVSESYRDAAAWTRKAILNAARMGRFSSDRAIQEYARDIWGVEPLPVGQE